MARPAALEEAILRKDPALSRTAGQSGTRVEPATAEDSMVRRTVTFLLAEIEVSAAPGDPSAVALDALSRQEGVLVEGVEAKGGTVYNQTGDGLSAVFDNATDALGAALQSVGPDIGMVRSRLRSILREANGWEALVDRATARIERTLGEVESMGPDPLAGTEP